MKNQSSDEPDFNEWSNWAESDDFNLTPPCQPYEENKLQETVKPCCKDDLGSMENLAVQAVPPNDKFGCRAN